MLTFIALLLVPVVSRAAAPQTLKSAFKGLFEIGTALNRSQITGKDTAGLRVVKEQFSAIVAENEMKSMYLQPEEGLFDFRIADQFVAFGEQNDKFITGHVLIWHSQLPDWFCVDAEGNNVSPEVLKARMKSHIATIVGRYKGRIKGWDVVNEAILDNGEWRKSKFYEILGEEFIALAFQYAHEADPDAELYYNDYNEWHPGKRDAIVRMVKSFKERGIRIDGVGLQGHIGMEYPSLAEYESCILAYANAGVKVMITELDVSALPMHDWTIGADIAASIEYRNEMNPYPYSLPAEVAASWTKRVGAFFDLFLKHRDKISRVTMWGVADADSWKNDFPIKGRTDYPLLFDRAHQPKPVVDLIIKRALETK